MKCREIEELLFTDYLDNEAQGETVGMIEAHLAGCAGCRGLLGEVKAALTSRKELQSKRNAEPPNYLWMRVMGELEERSSSGARRGFWFFGNGFAKKRVLFATAAATVLLLVFTFIVGPPGENDATPYAGLGGEAGPLALFEDNGIGEIDFGTKVEEFFL